VVYDEFYFPMPRSSKPSGRSSDRCLYDFCSIIINSSFSNSFLPSIYIFSSIIISLLEEKYSSAQTHNYRCILYKIYNYEKIIISKILICTNTHNYRFIL